MSARALCEGREGAGGLQVPHKEWTDNRIQGCAGSVPGVTTQAET